MSVHFAGPKRLGAWFHLLALVATSGACVAQKSRSVAATGSVTGHVTCSDTQRPARLAQVFLQPIVDASSYALQKDGSRSREGNVTIMPTQLDGSFVIPNVAPGRYYVIAEQEGYISPLSEFTREELNHPDGALLARIAKLMTVVSVSAGRTTQTEVQVIRGGAIDGIVRFDDGSPAIHTQVTLLRKGKDGMWTEARPGTVAHSFSGFRTDDEGRFRIGGLPEGEYLVKTRISVHGYASDHVFGSQGGTAELDEAGFNLDVFPGDTFRPKDAKATKVNEGAESSGVEIDVPVSELYTVSGSVLQDGTAHVVNGAEMELVYADDDTKLASTKVRDDGQFHFLFVPAGQFVLKAAKVRDVDRKEIANCDQCMPPTHMEEHTVREYSDGKQPLIVQSDVSSVNVTVRLTQKQSSAAPASTSE